MAKDIKILILATLAAIILSILILTSILAIKFFVYRAAAPAEKSGEGDALIQKKFDDKIIYNSFDNQNKDQMIADCLSRGGIFNSCGSVCPNNSRSLACPAVCAYTCDLYPAADRCKIIENKIFVSLHNANYCENSQDCLAAREYATCSFGCVVFVNKNADLTAIKEYYGQYLKICPPCEYDCFAPWSTVTNPGCVDNICISQPGN